MLATTEYTSGKSTATGNAKSVKNNLQITAHNRVGKQAGDILIKCLRNRREFINATLPCRIRAPLFSRYEVGMAYGDHLDMPLIDANPTIRTDVSCTIFLNNADEYGGGELSIDTGHGVREFKGNSGDIIIYPSSYYHHIKEVTDGQRQVAVTWIQSRVRDSEKRHILFDLATTMGRPGSLFSQTKEGRIIQKSYYNLVRMWADT